MIAGDSVGGNMAAALTIMAKQRGDVTFKAQALLYPVTDASFDTASYHQFAEGYWLRRDAMQWFWDQYTTDPSERAEITASPLRATAEDLAGLPRRSSSTARRTSCATRARPTRATCAPPAWTSPRPATAARSTTS